MSKEKKELTLKQQRNRYRNLKNASRVGEIAVIPVPFIVMAIVNRNEWFPNPDAGWRVGIGGGLAIGLMLLATLLVSRQKEKKSEITDGYVTILLGWALGAAIATLVRDIADQIANIMWVGMSGIAAGFGLDLSRKKLLKKEERCRIAIESAQAELDKERAREELQKEKTVKVKIKK